MGIGIQETKDVVIAGNEAGLFLVEQILDPDNFTEDVEDILDKLKEDADFVAKLNEARKGIEQVPDELEDLTIIEGGDLMVTQASFLPRWVKLIRDHKRRKKAEATEE